MHIRQRAGIDLATGFDDCFGSKPVKLNPSRCFPVCASKQTQGVYEFLPGALAAMSFLHAIESLMLPVFDLDPVL
jgi:hypothetical protein